MAELPHKEASFWVKSTEIKSYPSLEDGIDTQTVVIGAGIAGLSAAYMLAKNGHKVVVLEKTRIANGVTGHTTGKITSQHGLCYARLQSQLGEDDARIYAEANQLALVEIEKIINEENIECAWQKENNYVFTENKDHEAQFKHEAKIAAKLGLPAHYTTKIPLPFPVKAAVRFSDQAKMHPKKYLAGLARAIEDNGGLIYENTEAKAVKDGESCLVNTDKAVVRADNVIIATNVPYPWMAHGYYCALEYPLKSYIIACRTSNNISGMYITPGRLPYSILPIGSGRSRLLLIGGRSHVPGLNISTKSRFETLARYASMNFDIDSIEYMWSARDYLGYDDKPLAGKLYPWSKSVYVSTGFMKWGLTNATAMAMILRDKIMGEENRWAKTFDTKRFKPVASIPYAARKYLS